MKHVTTRMIVPGFFLVAFLAVAYFMALSPRHTDAPVQTVTLKKENFSVRVANTNELRARGLSGSEPLLKNEGMLFIFPDMDFHGFWMKDMLYPIDIVWFDDNRVIVDFEERVEPKTYPTVFSPDLPAQYVIELPSGTVSRLGITRGEKFFWSN